MLTVYEPGASGLAARLGNRFVVNAPLTYNDTQVKRDIATLKAAANKHKAAGVFLPVVAPASARADHAYSFRLACTLPDERRTLAGAELYVKDSHLVVTPDFEKLSGGLMARTRDNVIQLTVPASTLKPGKYEVLVVGQKSSRGWTLEVR